MTIPRKGSRVVDVAGRKFRWSLSPKGKVAARDRMGRRDPMRDRLTGVLTVQEDVKEPGHVLQHELYWFEDHAVTPEVIREVIRRAVDAGWDPASRQKFRLHGEKIIVENIMES
jgi:hypothetical protein